MEPMELGLKPGDLFARTSDGWAIIFDRQDGYEVYGHVRSPDGTTFRTQLVDSILNKGSIWDILV